MASTTSTTAPGAEGVLQFQPLQSTVDSTFWMELANNKLEKYRLSEEPCTLQGYYTPARSSAVSAPLQLTSTSLALDGDAPSAAPGGPQPYIAWGSLYNVNTLDRFKSFDRERIMAKASEEIWCDIRSGAACANPALLNRFVVYTFADLKRYSFYYWFAFPALVPPAPMRAAQIGSLDAALGADLAAAVVQASESWRGACTDATPAPAWLVWLPGTNRSSEITASPLTDWAALQERDGEVILAFCDPCNLPSNPGWPLRNLLLLAAAQWGSRAVRVVCAREKAGRLDPTFSLMVDAVLPEVPAAWPAAADHPPSQEVEDPAAVPAMAVPKTLGWEVNARGRMGPRCVDLGPTMDPTQLATQAVDLNLKLMRWRVLPELNTEMLAATKCLLLGSGTLGCAVARTLQGWGFRHITMVDNGKVSYSNPVRQSLFEFEDCKNGGRPKAEAAAERLKAIFPGVKAAGEQLHIPMPGHNVSPQEEGAVMRDVARLEELVLEHDAVFMLMDTRESRWLPTVLCAHHEKIGINCALGFDGYVVMRHGHGLSKSTDDVAEGVGEASCSSAPRLGCYFCNDVVAPIDSTRDRTLDQQCTVTRPGLAPIAGALAVELLVTLLHHPQGDKAAADTASSEASPESPLGLVPHQIRGSIAHLNQLLIHGPAFKQCTACSPQVVQEWRTDSQRLVMRACNEPKYLEDLTGLTAMHTEVDSAMEAWGDEDENSDEDDF
ncbi:Ubiquitin-like modifier-activating enzyme ATG7 [Cymbomonas tetramitiformis]|uniref:Ubiquitin-like modifier-activating enzyme ATG7 n=1 Tax=Cymbomonas tetramitiformis TaxID=36881 RepID=A0AAE0C552_9CHLO|nr:Ubiquitin-like modifier-activating enzyme ATG7 [Cymbomonas tetramitiformis]